MSRKALLTAVVLLLTPAAVFAQTGCVNSPECPTLVLGLVGTASAIWTAGRAGLARSRKNRVR